MALAAMAGIVIHPASAQQAEGYSQLDVRRPDAAADLNAHLTRLGENPRDVNALIGAGEAALALDNPRAATGFFVRADEISSNNGRIKSGLARAMLQMQNPSEALRLFDQAARFGYQGADMLADRGLAYDLSGDQARAQADYVQALRSKPDDPVLIKRYAVSLGISGKVDAAEKAMEPLLYKNDREAWRDRAFILAMNGRHGDALAITQKTMPRPLADAIQPYMDRMPILTAAQKAAAVHFGRFPPSVRMAQAPVPVVVTPPAASAPVAAAPVAESNGRSRRSRSRDRQMAAASQPVPQAPARIASAQPPLPQPPAPPSEAEMAGRPDQSGPARAPARSPSLAATTAQQRGDELRPAQRPAASAQGQAALSQGSSAVAPRTAFGRLQAPVPSTGQPVATRPAASTAPAVAAPVQGPPAAMVQGPPTPERTAPAPVDRPVQVAAAAPSPMPVATAPAAATPPATAPSTPAPNPEATRSLADIIRELDVPEAERRQAVAAVDLNEVARLQAEKRRTQQQAAAEKAKKDAAAKAKAEAAAKAKAEAEEKARLAKNPARSWVQVGTGRDIAALGFTLRGLRKDYAAIAKQDAWTAPWGRTNRLVIGPFASFTRARAVEAELKKAGTDAFAWQSDAGEEVKPIGAK